METSAINFLFAILYLLVSKKFVTSNYIFPLSILFKHESDRRNVLTNIWKADFFLNRREDIVFVITPKSNDHKLAY